jgi:muramoyltetrapeptide carboxypeptidase
MGLVPGDVVRIVAPAGKGENANLSRVKAYVESLGLVALMKDDIYDPDAPFYSNTDEYRAQDLLEALLDDECKAIWCIRGGSGCIRLIKRLEADLPVFPAPTQKILIGYSDITVLHLYLQKKYGWPTMHGAMLESIVNGFYDPEGESVTSLRNLLFDVTPSICEPTLRRLDNGESFVPIDAVVTGGNLTLAETSIGTLWGIEKSSGKIMFLEDTGEAAYSVERSLDHMKQAGVFDGVLALVFGDFTSPDNEALMTLALQRFADDRENVNFPVFRLQGIGHGPVNFPLPLNTRATITVEDPELRTYTLCVSNLTKTEVSN